MDVEKLHVPLLLSLNFPPPSKDNNRWNGLK
jgi:hypothetical protein